LQDLISRKVLLKADSDCIGVVHRVLFDVWVKLVETRKGQKELDISRTKDGYHRLRHKDDVRSLMIQAIADGNRQRICICLNAWRRWDKSEKYLKNTVASRVSVRRKNVEKASKVVAKWAVDTEDVSLGVVWCAFVQNVADARATAGNNKVLHVKREWRSSALKDGQQIADALDARDGIKALLGWKVLATQEKRESLLAQCGDWSVKYQEVTSQSQVISSHCDSLRQNLAVQLLSSEQRSEEAMEQSDKLRGCTGALWTEMHRQNLALDSLEHEVLLLEALQHNGTRLTSIAA